MTTNDHREWQEQRQYKIFDISREVETPIKTGTSKFWDDPAWVVPAGYSISHVHTSAALVNIYVRPDEEN